MTDTNPLEIIVIGIPFERQRNNMFERKLIIMVEINDIYSKTLTAVLKRDSYLESEMS